MIIIHALWTNAQLHLWGEHALPPTRKNEESNGSNDKRPRAEPFAASHQELRQCIGDSWDSLLVSGAKSSALALRLPHVEGRPVPSTASHLLAATGSHAHKKAELQPCRVRTLVFEPADAVDLLSGSPAYARADVRCGDSLRYWSRVAKLTLELLARQRFVPAVHAGSEGHYRGYWRVVVDDEQTSAWLRDLILSMPPVCRAMTTGDSPIQASALVENFLWTAVDALVRRCLEGDELAHALHKRADEENAPQTLWLRSLVRGDPGLTTTPEEGRAIHETVQEWITRLEPDHRDRTCRTCFRLQAASPPEGTGHGSGGPSWHLTLHVQATGDPAMVVDGARLGSELASDPMILQRPFAGGLRQLRQDVAQAARHFPPLAECAEPNGPLECRLTLEEAYRFLRDVAPILEVEGFGVWLPQWWSADRPRLRMRLDIHPLEGHTPATDSRLGLNALVAYDWRVATGDDTLSLDEIKRLAEAKVSLVRLRGRWAEIQVSEVQAALRFLQEHRGGQMTVFEALRLSYAADDLETGVPMVGLRAHGWIDRLLNASNLDETIEPVEPPKAFRGTLRPYQTRGLQWLGFLGRHGLGACLADDMGLGKTIQLIALLLHERESGKSPGPTLLVVPMSLVGNWQREIARFAPSLNVLVHHGLDRLTGQEFVAEVAAYHVVIATYGLTYRDREHLAKVDWHRVALDEAQNVKNPAAKQAMAIRSLRSDHRVALTGTPVENHLTELWSIMDFLNPGYLGTATDFRRRFAVPVERHHDPDRTERLRYLIRPFVLRRLKDDPNVQVDLPDKLEMTVFCNLTPEQAALYESVVSDMLGQIDSAGGIQRRGLILATLVRLKQICNHPAHFHADHSPLSRRSGKCDRLTEMLEEVLAEGHRALIFTQFRAMGHLLAQHLRETLGHEILFMHGGTAQPDRVRMVDRFQQSGADGPLFILSLKTGGIGLNLTAANHVFHYDRWWNPAVEDQATDRAHRIGQHQQVQVHKFVCVGTLEERIAALIEQKRSLARNIVGAGEEWITELSTEALRELFSLSREAIAED